MSTTADHGLMDIQTRLSAGQIASQGYWISCVILNILMIVCQVWAAGRFALYVYRRAGIQSRLSGGIILKSAALATALPLVRFGCTFAAIIVELDGVNDNGCEVAIDFGKAAFALATFFVYGFFWVRQRAFYNHPSLGDSLGKNAGIFSKASICILTLLLIVIIPLSVFPSEYEANGRGCAFRNGEKIYGFRDYLYAAVMLFCQSILMGLFLHPLWLHNKAQKSGAMSQLTVSTISKNSGGSSPSIHTGTVTTSGEEIRTDVTETRIRRTDPQSPTVVQNPFNFGVRPSVKVRKSCNSGIRRRARVLALMKRTLFVALAAALTDLIVMIIVGVIMPLDSPQVVTRVIYDADLFINATTVLVSFTNWPQILFWSKNNSRQRFHDESSIQNSEKAIPVSP